MGVKVLAVLALLLSGCVVGNRGLTDEEFREKYNLASPTPTPKPSPSPKPKEVWDCRYSSREGRVFTSAEHENKEESRAEAKRVCERASRSCVPLHCQLIILPPKQDDKK